MGLFDADMVVKETFFPKTSIIPLQRPARALIGKNKEDTVEVEIPGGVKRLSRRFRGKRHRRTWCATMTAHTARSSDGGFGRWGSEIDQYRPGRRGRTHMRND